MSPRLAVLLSGGGRSLQNLIDRVADGRLDAEVALVVSDKPDAFGLERARRSGVPTLVSKQGSEIFERCRESGIDLVCLAGYLRFLPIPDDFAGRVMNIHPSLLPAFGGKGMYGDRVHRAALKCGVKVSGCTVHFADNEYDTGPIILQRAVAVEDDDTPESLAARVFAEECEAYPEAISLFGQGRLRVEGRHVRRG